MTSYLLFIQGSYQKKDITFYRKLCRGCVLVAVDGGYHFFKLSGLTPDILIGDFDSIGKFPAGIQNQTKIIKYPHRKNSTDLQLAIEHCCSVGARKIDVVSSDIGETDHFLGNAMLLLYMKKKYPVVKLRLLNPSYEIVPLINDKLIFRNAVGSRLSILPISERIELSLRGTEYRGRDLTVRLGETTSLRNMITAKTAQVFVAGKALVIRQFP